MDFCSRLWPLAPKIEVFQLCFFDLSMLVAKSQLPLTYFWPLLCQSGQIWDLFFNKRPNSTLRLNLRPQNKAPAAVNTINVLKLALMPQVGVVTDYFGILTIHRDLNFTFWESQGMLAAPTLKKG